MKKLLYIVGGVVVVAVVAVALVVFVFSGSIIKSLIEDVGSKATQAKVTVDSVDISLVSGAGSIKGLVVGNPKGYKSPQAFKLGEVSVKVDTGSVTGNPVVIKEVVISAPDVTYELGGPEGSNITAIQKNAQAFAGGAGGGGAAKPAGQPAPSQPAAKGEPEKKVVIENLYVRNGKVNVTASALGGKPLGTSLPDIHLTNIGKSSDGASPAQVADQVIGAISKAAQSAVSKIGADQLKGLVGGKADELMKQLGTQVPAGLPGTGSSGSSGSSSSPLSNPGGAINKLFGK